MDASAANLRLPGQGHSLWVSASQSPTIAAVSLPGAGYTLWTDGKAMPSAVMNLTSEAVQLPGHGTSVWMEESFAQSSPPPVSTLSSAVTLTTAAATSSLSLPGNGHSLWKPASLAATSLTLASSLKANGPSGNGIKLPGEGHSLWASAKPATISSSSSEGRVRLLGGSHTLWTQPHVSAAAAISTSAKKEKSFAVSSTQQPSLIARTMKLFGFAQCLGVLLIIALLFGFLGSREQAETLKTALADEEKEHFAAREEGQGYHDQVIGLQKELKASAEKEAALTGEIDVLAKAKTGIENTMKTQIANLEQANNAAGKAKADLDAQLTKLTAASKTKEAELTQAITDAKGNLAKSQEEAATMKASLDDLAKAKADIEAKLNNSAEALQKTKSEMEGLKSQLDQAEKSKSDLQKEMDDLKKALEAKEKEAKKTEGEDEDANNEVS